MTSTVSLLPYLSFVNAPYKNVFFIIIIIIIIMIMIITPNILFVLKNKEFQRDLSDVYGKQQTSDSSWEFYKTENDKLKTAQNNNHKQH